MSAYSSQIESKKKFLSDNETTDISKFFHSNNIKIKEKISELPNPKDYPSSMSDGRLFQKFAIEYIKNILFKGFNCKFSENIAFNFMELFNSLLNLNIPNNKTNYIKR